MATQRRGRLQETVKTFSSLLSYRRGHSPADAQKKARSAFPRKVAGSRLTLRDPEQPLPPSVRHFIIGVATYAADELGLLDELDSALGKGKDETTDVAVFDVLDCERMTDFQRYIPGIDGVYDTPVIGVIMDGKLIDRATGLSGVLSTLRRFNVIAHS
jgi:hypothetical protein